jgi:alpha-glucan,water dikinase
MAATLDREGLSFLDDRVSVRARREEGRLMLLVCVRSDAACVLHWGLTRRDGGAWDQPPESCWPAGTTPAEGGAVRTPLTLQEQGEQAVTITLVVPCPARQLVFVVHFPQENRWLKNDGRDFCVPLPENCALPQAEQALQAWLPGEDVARQVFTLTGGIQLASAVETTSQGVRVGLACDMEPPLVLHWGLAWQFRHEWALPPETFRPEGTTPFDAMAVHTPFTSRDGLQSLELHFQPPAGTARPRGMIFVLHQPKSNGWLNKNGKDIYLSLFAVESDPRLGSPRLEDLAEQIVGAEMGASSWTLMHRFNLCHDLLEKAQDDEDALALLYAWLRYSATRRLDWQRNYNTKPRDLSHAQDRLTARLAGVQRRARASSRTWPRLMLTTLGRGGDGQRVRDEILNIMHRHHIKETSGHFIEEWHQKLHNNTTPDDVVLCEAYLAFLRSNGDQAQFYKTLEAGGVTRERLQSFERPIRSEPAFFADKKDGLIPDFEHFLRILKSVHAGTDLEAATGAARGRLNPDLNRQLDGVLGMRRREHGVREFAGALISARTGLRQAMNAAGDDGALRDLLFLDLALEETLRGEIERQNLSRCDRDKLVDLVGLTLRSLSLTCDAGELGHCTSHWAKLGTQPREGRDWALHAKSVLDRAARWLQSNTDDLYRRLQPRAEYLGAAFAVDAWVVSLFSEEVVRGGPTFALSLLLRHLDPLLRKAAGLGGWQIISPAPASGRVRLVDRLLAVQGERFAEATVLVTDTVAGNEEIPEGVSAVLTADAPDLVSHVAVRARNAHVLFASCFDAETYRRLKEFQDRPIQLRVTPGGDVEYSEGNSAKIAPPVQAAGQPPVSIRRAQTNSPWVVTQDQFTSTLVGGKANNLNGLRGRVPEWIHLPNSLALPFGSSERVLQDDRNRALRGEFESLVAAAEQNPAEVLAKLRELYLHLVPPPELQSAVQQTWQRVGLSPVPWDQAWQTIRRVWAAKWNDRAYLSRRARGVLHADLFMSVLIQQVVPAEYAYVIHTANPLTGNRDEIYAEVVLGLGETIVGNYPGRALGCVCRKTDLQPQIVSYPGKSVGLFGRGVIFRSDSNGEDLAGFAGAGLYDSYLAEAPLQRLLDYREEKLVWDAGFRNELLRSIARVGLEVEKLLGSAQDIEGAVAGGKFHVVQTRPQVGLT